MNHAQDLLQDVFNHPDDDRLRLLYAEFLDEQGEYQRAEFIRVQVALADHDDDIHPNFSALAGREACLVESAPAWLFMPWTVTDDFTWHGLGGDGVTLEFADIALTWRRGFLESVSCPTSTWKQYGPQLCRQHPIRKIKLADLLPPAPSSGLTSRYVLARDRVPDWLYNVLQYPNGGQATLFRSYDATVLACNMAALRWARAQRIQSPTEGK